MRWLLSISISVCALLLAVSLLSAARPAVQPKPEPEAQAAQSQTPVEMPRPRYVNSDEPRQMADLIYRRFRVRAVERVAPRAAGDFRFYGTRDFLYIDRTDLGSSAFESARYGVTNKALDPQRNDQSRLLPRINEALRRAGLDVKDKQFAQFQDEFIGAARPKGLPQGFDPRKASRHVARTAAFQRVMDGIPFFNSELLVGLNRDGNIGRFRLHWPDVPAAVIEEARELQRAVREGKWQMPGELREKDVTILNVAAGVGHSGFADPGFRARGVIRVLFRRNASGTQYPISSTGYKFFDGAGREVLFSAFPQIPGTTLDQKYQGKR
jgi:hypothetical protein